MIGVRLEGNGHFLREVKVGSELSAKIVYRVKQGDFIYSRLFAWRGAYGVIDDDLDGFYVSNEFPVFRPLNDKIDVRFLNCWFRLRPVLNAVEADCSGSTPLTRNRYKEEFFLLLKIPLHPLSEQRRIVEKIEQLAAKIEEVNGLRAKTFFETDLLISLAIELKCFHSGHPIKLFGDLLIESTNGLYKPAHYWGKGIPCIRMYNIEGPGMNEKNLKMLDVNEVELKKYQCKPGDLIFNRVNSAELVGKTGLITDSYPQCTFESKNMRLRIDHIKVLPQYAAQVLNSFSVKRYYRESLKQQCGMATLNQQHVRNIPFSLPPLEEQHRIIEYFDKLQFKVKQQKILQSKTSVELNALLPSILDKAFRGEL